MTHEITNQAFILAVPSLVLTILCVWFVKRYFSQERAGSLTDTRAKHSEKGSSQQQKKKQQPQRNSTAAENQKQYTHPWLLTTLKAHTSPVLDVDFSPNKKYVASCAEDRTVMLWHVKDFQEKNHRAGRSNIEYDHSCKVRWSPDSKAFVISRYMAKDLEVYKINKMADGYLGRGTPAVTFPQFHKGELVGLGIASSGKFIMTCSADTKLVIWSIKGEILTSIDTRQVDVYFADVSPCGRFVASCGFTSDVKVWHVTFDKTGAFKELTKAYELKGHSAGVECFAFNSDSSRMASVSKDKTWKFWKTDVEYEKGQEPQLIYSVNVPLSGPAKIALSFDGRVVAIVTGSTLRLFSTLNGKEERSIDNESRIQLVTFDQLGAYVVVAVNKHIRLFHNVVGYHAVIQELEEQRKKPSISQSMKQRMQQQILEAKAALQAIGAK